MLHLVIGFIFGGFCLCASVCAAPAAPIEIFADQVDVDLDAQTTLFKGHVKLLFSPYTARCSSAAVYLNRNTQKVEKIVMSGQVIIEKGSQVLKGKRIVLDVVRNRLKIEGQVYTRFQLQRPINLKLN